MPYIDSYMNTCLGKDQTAFRVQDTSKRGECAGYHVSKYLKRYLMGNR